MMTPMMTPAAAHGYGSVPVHPACERPVRSTTVQAASMPDIHPTDCCDAINTIWVCLAKLPGSNAPITMGARLLLLHHTNNKGHQDRGPAAMYESGRESGCLCKPQTTPPLCPSQSRCSHPVSDAVLKRTPSPGIMRVDIQPRQPWLCQQPHDKMAAAATSNAIYYVTPFIGESHTHPHHA